jgi:hypothetical protein
MSERDIIVDLLPMVMGRRSEYTDKFIEFLLKMKKERDMITADQVGGDAGPLDTTRRYQATLGC